MARRESAYQADLIKRIKELYPEALIMKNDTDRIQGVPDLIILWMEFWAALEVKASSTADRQPNQEYYIRHLDDMSFAAFICPENEEEVLHALQQAFTPRRRARVS